MRLDSEKLRVLIVTGKYPPAFGGGALRAHRTYKRLSAVASISCGALTTTVDTNESRDSLYEGVRVLRIARSGSLLLQMSRIYRLFERHKLYDYHVLHGFGDSPVVVASSHVAKWFGMKLIREMTVIQEPEARSVFGMARSVINHARFGYLQAASHKRADLLIALNDAIRHRYLRMGISDRKIWKRPNPVDTSQYSVPSRWERERIRDELKLKPEDRVILLAGKIQPRKNQLFAIKALTRLPDQYLLLMIGPLDADNPTYLDQIRNHIAQHGVGARVRLFAEYRSDLRMLYHAADTTWITSTSEGTPNVMLESLCSGVPVVVNKALKLGEYIDENCGFEADLHPDAFAGAMMALEERMLDQEWKAGLAAAAQRRYGSEQIDAEFARRIRMLCDG